MVTVPVSRTRVNARVTRARRLEGAAVPNRGTAHGVNVQTLTSLYQHAGPFVSIYLATDGSVPNAMQQIELRWKDVIAELAGSGVDEGTRQALTAARGPEPHKRGGTRVLIAAGGAVRLALSLPEVPAAEVVRVAPLPYLLPLLDWAQTRIPHVIALTDRRGADILAYTDAADPDLAASVDTERHPEHKTGTGGWAALRYERTVEENWHAGERDIAAAVEQAAEKIGAELIIAGGDPQTVEGMRGHLSKPVAGKVVTVTGGRSEDGSDDRVAEQVLEHLAARAAATTIDLLADFGKYRNRAARQARSPEFGGGRPGVATNAADGTAETVTALRRGQVATLLLSDLLHEEDPAFFGPEPTDLALDAQELRDLGTAAPERGALVDVLLRAAIGTGAAVRLVPGDTEDSPQEGVGALLRFSSDS